MKKLILLAIVFLSLSSCITTYQGVYDDNGRYIGLKKVRYKGGPTSPYTNPYRYGYEVKVYNRIVYPSTYKNN